MKIVRLSDLPVLPMAMAGAEGVGKQLPLGSADGAPHFSFRVFTIAPGGHTPYHVHPSEHLNYVISGQGALVDPEGRMQPLAAGDFAFVPPEEKHQYRNASDSEPFVMICAVPRQYE